MSLQAAGLREGDYIVSLNGQPCKWWRHAEVVARLKGVGDEGASLQVVTLLPRAEPPGTVSPGGPNNPRCPEAMGKRGPHVGAGSGHLRRGPHLAAAPAVHGPLCAHTP